MRVPLAQALDLILERSAAQLTLLDGVDGEVTAEFDDVPFEDGLRRLLGPRSYVLVYTPEGAAPPDGRLKVISREFARATGDGRGPGHGRTAAPRPARVEAAPLPDPALRAAVEAGGRGATVTERVEFLEGVLAVEPEAGIRAAALKMLTVIDPSSLAPIARTARFDPSPEVRWRALELLVVRGQADQLVMDTLLVVGRTDSDATVREQALSFAKNLEPSLP